MKKHHISFKHASDGILHNFRTQPNFRIHLIAAIVAIVLGIYFQLAQLEWLVLLFTIVLVIITEMLNTALESIIDLLSPNQHLAAKIAKDTAAGMVLLSTIAAVIVGLVVFLPKVFTS